MGILVQGTGKMVRLSECSSYRGFELSSDFYESISEGSMGIQKQFELLEVRVIGSSSYRECTVVADFKQFFL